MCPLAARLVNGEGRLFARGRLVCHCLLVETDRDGLVLVETGFGAPAVLRPAVLPAVYRRVVGPVLDPGETATERVRALGHRPEDVRHVVVTHLDADHAGGLPELPWATVHVHAREREAATAQPRRYLPTCFAHGPRWAAYAHEGEPWQGLAAVRPLQGLQAEIALVPLFGHSAGHSGVAVRDGDRWLLHAGDAYFCRGQLEPEPWCPPGLGLFQAALAWDNRLRRQNLARLRELAARPGGEVEIFCAHDPVELERAAC